MRKIFVDLEMQPIHDKSKRRICRSEVIEIGAVMLDDSGKETDSFKQNVKPVYSDRLSNKISIPWLLLQARQKRNCRRRCDPGRSYI